VHGDQISQVASKLADLPIVKAREMTPTERGTGLVSALLSLKKRTRKDLT